MLCGPDIMSKVERREKMRKNCVLRLAAAVLCTSVLFGSYTCTMAAGTGNTVTEAPKKEKTKADAVVLEDGVYTAEFKTDSSMFRVNEANDGKGILTVKDGKMTIHISLVSKSILNLFPGTAEEAQKEGAKLLEPTTDTVTYSDGLSEEVYGFDVPVPALDEEFDLALIGKKGKWYDHTVSVSAPKPYEEDVSEEK